MKRNKLKTRHAYGEYNGKTIDLGDTIRLALQANLMVREYEEKLRDANPQLQITIKIEEKQNEINN